MTTAKALKGVAKGCLAAGTLLLAFVAYQIWGTAIYEHHAQAQLIQELKHQLGAPIATIPKTTAPSKGATDTSALVPISHVAPAIADPPPGTPVGLMSIPRIGMSGDAIVEGTDEHDLQQGPGHYQGTPLPGQAGNVAIAGHRTTYAHPFYNLNELGIGDLIYIQTNQGFFGYQVVNASVVAPTDTQVLGTTTVPQLTLTTCNPRYSASTRLVVTAVLRTAITSDSFPAGSQPRSSTTAPMSLAGETTGALEVSTTGEAFAGVLWGALAVAVVVLARLGWRRFGRGWRWAPMALGIPIALGLLFVCFQHVSLALPETF